MGGRGTGVRIDLMGDGLMWDGKATAEDLPLAEWNPQSKHKEVYRGEAVRQAERMMAEKSMGDCEYLAIIDRDGYVIRALEGENGAVGISPRTAEEMAGNHVTHYHNRFSYTEDEWKARQKRRREAKKQGKPFNEPKNERGFIGGCFSRADLKSGLTKGATTFSATCDEGNYRIHEINGRGNHDGLIKAYDDNHPKWEKEMNKIDRQTESEGREHKWDRQHRQAVSHNRRMRYLWEQEKKILRDNGYHASFVKNKAYKPVYEE